MSQTKPANCTRTSEARRNALAAGQLPGGAQELTGAALAAGPLRNSAEGRADVKDEASERREYAGSTPKSRTWPACC
eukprot:8370694-Alexandrium_andersonii.AAC.1